MVSKSELAIQWDVYRPRGWGEPSGSRALPRPWYGLDTERDSKSGKFVCGWVAGEKSARFERFTDLEPGTYWVWNLAYDAEGMLRDLGIAEAWAAKSDGSKFPLMDGTACYYHGKRFDYSVPKGGKWSFIEAASFFGRQPLSKFGAKENVDASKMSYDQYHNDVEYRNKIDSYCLNDARIVYDRITELSAGLTKLGVEIGATPGATARRFLSRLGQFPNVIWQTHKPFLRSYCGGRFEVTKRGVLHDVKQYDLVSAYPWALSNCPWLTDNAFHHLSRRFSDHALYGTYQVSFAYDNYLGVAPRWRGGVRVYSKKEEKTWLTRPEVGWLLSKGCDVKIHTAVEIFDENATTAWRDVITELFALKTKTKNEVDKGWGAKIILNSQYGVLIQLIRESGVWKPIQDCENPIDFAGVLGLEEPAKMFEGGKYYAPVYAGNLTGLTRVRLLDAAAAVGSEAYIGGHTDSILTMKNLTIGIGDGLGDWKLEKSAARADICKTGMYAIGDIVKVRGITRKGTPALLWEPNHTRNSRIGIKTADNWDAVSVILPKVVANNFTTEQKRNWHGEITRGLIAMEKHIDSSAWENVGVEN